MRNFDGGLNQDLKIDVRYILSDERLTENKRESTSHDTGVRNYPTLYYRISSKSNLQRNTLKPLRHIQGFKLACTSC